jgi:hypothetical protein
MRARMALLLSVLLGFLSPAFAHDESMHKGSMFEGTVQSRAGDKCQLKTDKEPVTIVIVKETKVEMGMEGAPATKEDIRVGDYLMVTGHKLESGELAAGEIIIHRKPEEQGKQPSGAHEGHEGMKMEHDMPGMP